MPFLPALAAAGDMDSEQVRAALRGDALNVIIALLCLGLGGAAVLVFRLRRLSRDPSLLWFGLFTSLYGLRLLLETHVVPFLADPTPRALWHYLAAAITYVIPMPAVLFFRALFPARGRILRWLFWASVVIAAAGLLLDQILRRPESLGLLDNLLTLGFFISIVAESWLSRKNAGDLFILRMGEIVFMAAVAWNHLSNFTPIARGFNPEPLGFAVFIGCVGKLAVSRTLADEERLVSLDNELAIARRIQSTIFRPACPTTNASASLPVMSP